MARDVRAVAAEVIAGVLGGQSLNTALPPQLGRVGERDRGLLQQLCYGTLRQYPRLQALLQPLLAKPLKDKDRDVQALLLLGLYQLEDTRVPQHAAVSATVAATRALHKGWAKGLVNAVLRRFLREREEHLQSLTAAQAAAHPQWLFDALQREWPAQAPSIMEVNNSQPPMTLRLNRARSDRDTCLSALAQAGIEASPGAISVDAIGLATPRDVASIPGFADGLLSVQDEAAQLAAQMLDPQPGERILDACAAPGGKSCHLLEIQPQLAELIAADISGERLARVQENLERLGLQAQLLEADASAPPDSLAASSFDRILVDAPCSASGVIRRHPDVKVLRREADIAGFARLQGRILDGLWPLLKPGGSLLYATCSVLDAENSAVVSAFLQRTADASEVSLPLQPGEACVHGRQLLPTLRGHDGLYYALLRKSTAL